MDSQRDVRRNFNPRSPHGERPAHQPLHVELHIISTHAPRTGSDRWAAYSTAGRTYFNPRSPHGERHGADGRPVRHDGFQPTLPARGATIAGPLQRRFTNFNPRSPHGERPVASPRPTAFFSFQPTLPARGATPQADHARHPHPHFNPRSPHGERPAPPTPTAARSGHFNPRSPHGERPEDGMMTDWFE